MISAIKRNLVLNLKNIPGWKTSRKIVVFESDDWGSLRMASAQHLQKLREAGVVSPSNATYDALDAMESKEDMEMLFEVLHSVKDKNNRPAVFTPFMNLANPDFRKIEAAGFKTYYYELFTETLNRLGLDNTMSCYREGIAAGVFLPEYHGREHINVASWMKALQAGEPKVIEGFKNEFASVNLNPENKFLESFRQTYFFMHPEEIPELEKSITEGIALFKQIFNYQTTVFDAPNAIFHPGLERVLHKGGIKNIVLQRFRSEPDGNGGAKNTYYKFGQRNEYGQVYHIRNCMFEPRTAANDKVCLNMMNAAFRWGKPAIITTHRVNYMGGIDAGNRKRSLESLSNLLKQIKKNWPDVEFMSSGEFSQLIHQS